MYHSLISYQMMGRATQAASPHISATDFHNFLRSEQPPTVHETYFFHGLVFHEFNKKNFLVAMCIKAETVVGLVSQLKPLVTFCAKIVILNLLACHISSDIYSIMVPSLVWTHKLSAHETARAWTICCKSGLNSTCLRDGRRRPLSFSAYAPPANFRM